MQKLMTTEDQIRHRLVSDILAAGHSITVNDGEDNVLYDSHDRDAILAAMASTDEDILLVHYEPPRSGWIKLINGNDCDLISDYTNSMESIIAPIYKWIEETEGYR